MLATLGLENYRKLKFPPSLTIPPMIAFTRLVLFAHSVLAGFGAPAAVLNKKGATLPRKVPRPIAILLKALLFVALGPFLWLPMEKAFMCRRIASTLLAKHCLHSHAARVAWNSFLPPPKRMNDNELQGENPTKWPWEKGSWRWVLDEVDALQNGSCF